MSQVNVHTTGVIPRAGALASPRRVSALVFRCDSGLLDSCRYHQARRRPSGPSLTSWLSLIVMLHSGMVNFHNPITFAREYSAYAARGSSALFRLTQAIYCRPFQQRRP